MTELEIDLNADLLRQVKRLAERHFGTSDEEAMGKVVESALQMRFLWLDIAEDAGKEVEEPVISLQTSQEGSGGSEEDITDWLFQKRG